MSKYSDDAPTQERMTAQHKVRKMKVKRKASRPVWRDK